MKIPVPQSPERAVARALFATVAVDRPLGRDHALTYKLVGALADQARVGSLVEVPLKNQTARGVILAINDEPAFKGPVKSISRLLTPEYHINEELMALGRWVAGYYWCDPGVALATVSFIGLNDVREKVQSHMRLADPARWIRLRDGVAEPQDEIAAEPSEPGAKKHRAKLSPAQARVIHALLALNNEPLPPGELEDEAGVGSGVLKLMIERGWIERTYEPVSRGDDYPDQEPAGEPIGITLNEAQAAAYAEMVDALEPGASRAFLLQGVTGSGKTEVYLRVIQEALLRGRTAIMLVPEIALTPQTVGIFRARLGSLVGVYHSRMTLGQKLDLWRRIAADEVRVLIGARSAVFGPLPRLGVIVVDEEHETSYKQGEAPRYHARDVAVLRAARAGAVAILGSATPSMESFHNAREGKYRLLELPTRVGPHASPIMTVVDMKRHLAGARKQAGGGSGESNGAGAVDLVTPAEREKVVTAAGADALISPPLREAIQARLDAGEQIVLLLNRRGFANHVMCLACEKQIQCPHCDVTLTYHKKIDRLMCHWCGHVEPPPDVCPACGAAETHALGLGTERVEEVIASLFPAARAIRIDVDTMTGRRSFVEAWQKISRREVDIILGTQMIAKGFHLESVTLVGVVSADFALFLPDFRSAERTFQLLTQVAGRAGRGDKPGEVIVQSFMPHHYAIERAARLEQAKFYDQELRARRMLRFPPIHRLIALLISGPDRDIAREQATRLANMLKSLAYRQSMSGVTLLGPAPAPIAKLKDQYRWRILIRGSERKEMRELLDEGMKAFAPVHLKAQVALAIDVDPTDLL